MNNIITIGNFCGTRKFYRSKNGKHDFAFNFEKNGGKIDIYCKGHPSLNGRDSSAHKTHLYSSGKVCFVGGKEPRNQAEADGRAKQWAENFLDYRRTGRSKR